MSEKMNIGYGVVEKDGETFSGGVMVTDRTGLPLEFRYTEPLTPTRIQKVLYGEVLESYIKGEVIIKSLLDHLENRPDIMVVGEDSMTELPDIGVPLVSLSETRLKPLREAGAVQSINDREYLLQPDDTGSPVRVKLISSGVSTDEINSRLVSAGKSMVVTEPIGRVHEALRLLCSKEQAK